MKFWVVALLLVSISFSKSVTTNPCEGLDLVFVNDYTSCSNYFSCVKGTAFQKVCPDGRWFHTDPIGCHLPNTVPCEVCPREGVVSVGVPNSCTEYKLCINGHEFDRECAPGTRFDRSEGRCNLQELVPCEYARCPETGRELKPDPTSCRHYLVCFDGDEVARRECNENLLFDSVLRSCALPDTVECGSRPETNMLLPDAPVVNLPSRFSANFDDVPTAPTVGVPTAPTVGPSNPRA